MLNYSQKSHSHEQQGLAKKLWGKMWKQERKNGKEGQRGWQCCSNGSIIWVIWYECDFKTIGEKVELDRGLFFKMYYRKLIQYFHLIDSITRWM